MNFQYIFRIITMLFFQFITYSCICQSPFQAYLEDYVSLINAYLDPHNSLEDREEFKYEIMSWHENGPKSVVYNHFRSDGTEYITIENYLENIFVDYENGADFITRKFVVDFDLRKNIATIYSDIIINEVFSARLKYIMNVSLLSPNRVSGKISSITLVSPKEEAVISEPKMEAVVSARNDSRERYEIGTALGLGSLNDYVWGLERQGDDFLYSYKIESAAIGDTCRQVVSITKELDGITYFRVLEHMPERNSVKALVVDIELITPHFSIPYETFVSDSFEDDNLERFKKESKTKMRSIYDLTYSDLECRESPKE